jgi:hypothetical protein
MGCLNGCFILLLIGYNPTNEGKVWAILEGYLQSFWYQFFLEFATFCSYDLTLYNLPLYDLPLYGLPLANLQLPALRLAAL